MSEPSPLDQFRQVLGGTARAMAGVEELELVFTAEVDVVPAFELPEIDESIVVEVAPTEVTDEDVEEQLQEVLSAARPV